MGFLEELKSKVREVDDAVNLRSPEERITCIDCVLPTAFASPPSWRVYETYV